MRILQILCKPPWRTIIPLLGIIGILLTGYTIWSPGAEVVDGRHDLGHNGIWLGHGWLGDDGWFRRYNKSRESFRNPEAIKLLAERLKQHGIKYVYPHLCPCDTDGQIALEDPNQTDLFLSIFQEFEVMPWVGGVLNQQCYVNRGDWRATFIESILALLERHPQLAGVQINIEPMPDGNREFLILLEELFNALPEGKRLSIAAYPPPSRWHSFPEAHWSRTYYEQVAGRCDQLVPMMYDTAIRWDKVYQNTMRRWTRDILEWSGETEVLLGIPAYEDAGVGYHHPRVENLTNALRGIHAGLNCYPTLPIQYQGVAIYCAWEMDESKWAALKKLFNRRSNPSESSPH